jgi:hypothetical protein
MSDVQLRDAWPAGKAGSTRVRPKAKTAIAGIGVAVLWCLLWSMPSAIAQAGEQPMPDASVIEPAMDSVANQTGDAGSSQARRPEVGMSLKEALALVGDDPDSEVGAACGMLDVLTWDEAGTKIISVDGTVTSIVEGKDRQP